MRRRLLLGAVAIACAFVACEREPLSLSFSNGVLGVYGFLVAGSDSVRVAFVRYDPNVRPFRASFAPVRGARGRLIGEDRALTLSEVSGRAGFLSCFQPHRGEPRDSAGGCYVTAVPEGLPPRTRYELELTTAGGDRVTGVATVPDTIGITRPSAGARLTVPSTGFDAATLVIDWNVPRRTRRLEVDLRPADERCRLHFEIVAESTVVAASPGRPAVLDGRPPGAVTARISGVGCFNEIGEPAPWDSVPARLVVAAFDSAYARYADAALSGGAANHDAVSVGLENAVGVFTGVARREVRIVLVSG